MGPLAQALAHLRKAEEFLQAAEFSADLELYNAATSDAVVSGINSKDAICLTLTGRSGKADDHTSAVAELRAAGREGAELATTLSRLLAVKTRSQYQVTSIAAADARQSVDRARKLFSAATLIVAPGAPINDKDA